MYGCEKFLMLSDFEVICRKWCGFWGFFLFCECGLVNWF